VEVFVCAAALYLVLAFVTTRLVQALEWWLSPHLRGDPSAATASESRGRLGESRAQ
jgi:octopine/nopaline transport system permease protein